MPASAPEPAVPTGPRRRLQALKPAVFRRIPVFLRVYVVRALTPSFHVGAICVIERSDGALLLVRQSYRRREAWGFPGGLLKRGEEPSVAVRREVGEELGVEIDVEEPPMVVIEPRLRRVDVIYRGRLTSPDGPAAADAPITRGGRGPLVPGQRPAHPPARGRQRPRRAGPLHPPGSRPAQAT